MMRALVHDNAPDAVESMSYQMPAFKLSKPSKPLVYFAAFADELAAYTSGKGFVQFPYDQPHN
jgi:uncharacterized protein YdhG (YjbR/CyaY superfamily)